MDWKQFFASAIASLAWPIAVVSVVCVLKSSFAALLLKVRSLKYGDLHLDLGKEIETVKAEISALDAEAETPVMPPPPPPPTIVQLASLSPRAAVLTSWLEVEKEIEQVIERHQLSIATPNKTSPLLKMRVLGDRHLIDDNTMTAFKRLFVLRNQAVHLTEVEIGYSDAIAIAELCEWLIQKLKEA